LTNRSLLPFSENRDIHQTIPDHRVKITQEGWQQAYEAGRRLRGMLRPDDTLHFFTSPYRRTRETTEGILATLTSDDPEPSPFKRSNIKVYEEPRLREQDFGNFQPCSAEMERMWQERADYGHFFYRIPNGESAADAYDRVSGFNESLWRQFGEDDFASVCVLGKLPPIPRTRRAHTNTATSSHPRPHVPRFPHEVVPLQRRAL
jgi:broad specificity phosphatase PhoE